MNTLVYSNTKDDAIRFVRRLKLHIFFGFGFSGICQIASESNFDYVHDIFCEWDEFSGERSFPVPSKNDTIPPRDMYLKTANLWNRFSKYGRARIRLAKFIIKHIEQNIYFYQW